MTRWMGRVRSTNSRRWELNLANLRDDAVRKQYTDLTEELEKIMINAKRTPLGEFNGSFAAADQMFSKLNDDCVKSAKDGM